jgi:tetratricopeptide (TPR) repeat protein
LTNQSLVRLLQGDYEGAELPLAEVMAIIQTRKNLRDSPFAAIVWNNMACLQIRKDELGEAEELATKALEITTRHGKSANAAAFPLVNIGWIRMKQHRPAEAEVLLKDANELFEKKLPLFIVKRSVTYAHTNGQIMLADALYQQDKTDQANAVCDGIIAALAQDDSCIAITSVTLLINLADTLMSKKDFARAERLLEHTYSLVRQFPVHPDSQPLLLSYTQLLCLTDRQSELNDLKSWCRPVLLNAP